MCICLFICPLWLISAPVVLAMHSESNIAAPLWCTESVVNEWTDGRRGRFRCHPPATLQNRVRRRNFRQSQLTLWQIAVCTHADGPRASDWQMMGTERPSKARKQKNALFVAKFRRSKNSYCREIVYLWPIGQYFLIMRACNRLFFSPSHISLLKYALTNLFSILPLQICDI